MAFEGIRKKINCLAVRLQDWRNTDQNAFTLFTTLLFYMGLWPRKNDRQGFGAFYRKWLPGSIFVMLTYTMAAGLPVITYQYLVTGNVQPLLESVAITFACVLMFAHMYCLLFQKNKLREVFVEIDVIREMGKRLPYRPDAILLLNMRWMEKLMLGMVICGVNATITLSILFQNLYFSRRFGFNEWFLVDTSKSPVYEILFILKGLRMTYLIIMMVLLYMIICGLLVETVGQYRILLHNIDQVRCNSSEIRNPSPTQSAASSSHCEVDEELGPMQGDDPHKPQKNPKSSVTDLEALKLCIQHHMTLIRFVHVVESTFEPILLLHIICTMVPTGLGIALIMNAAEVMDKFVMIIFLISCCYGLLAVICLLGNKITEQDEGIRDALYGCDWQDASMSLTKSMRIVMSKCNRPLVIKLVGFIPLNRANFFATMKLTYSYTMAMITQFK